MAAGQLQNSVFLVWLITIVLDGEVQAVRTQPATGQLEEVAQESHSLADPQLGCRNVRCEEVVDPAADRNLPKLWTVQSDLVPWVAWKTLPGSLYSIQLGSRCDEKSPIAVAIVNAWIDEEDPTNKSIIEVFVDPGTELNKLSQRLYLCGNVAAESFDAAPSQEAANSQCLCELQTHAGSGYLLPRAVQWSVGLVPSFFFAVFRSEIDAEMRCPAPWLPDAVVLALLLAGLLVACVWIEAAVAAFLCSRGQGEVAQKEQPGILKFASPWKVVPGSAGAAVGAVALISNMQCIGLNAFMELATHRAEVLAWLSLALSGVFGVVLVWRLHQVLCRMQLVQGALANDMSLEGTPSSTWFDSILLLGLLLFLLTVVLDMIWELEGSTAALVWCFGMLVSVVAGPLWGIAKAFLLAAQADAATGQVPTDRAHLAKLLERTEISTDSAKCRLVLLSWDQLVNFCRAGGNPLHLKFDVDVPQDGQPGGKSRFNLVRDVLWHRRAIHSLTRSHAGFVACPSFLTALLVLLGFTCMHATSFACSRGALFNLELTNSQSALDFRPWRDRYAIGLEKDVTEVAIFAAADASMATSLDFSSKGDESETSATANDAPFKKIGMRRDVLETAQPDFAHVVPFAKTVSVQGPRMAQAPKRFELQFMPRQTLPVLLMLEDTHSRSFKRTIAWANLPKTRLSVPPGVPLSVTVWFVNFTLGIPRGGSVEPPAQEALFWTALEPMTNATQSDCTSHCQRHEHCLAAYPGKAGCYMAIYKHDLHDATSIERSVTAQYKQMQRGKHPRASHLYGELCGCSFSLSEGPCCSPLLLDYNKVTFRHIVPEWPKEGGGERGATGPATSFNFRTTNFDAARWFRSEPVVIELRGGAPVPSAVSVRLLAHLAASGEQRLLGTNVSVDSKAGELQVTIARYNPATLQEDIDMQLEVQVLFEDDSFEAVWPSFVQQVAGKAILPLSPWSVGALGPSLGFSVQLPAQHRDREADVWGNVTPAWSVNVGLQGVDSTVAWYFEDHGCDAIEEVDRKYRGSTTVFNAMEKAMTSTDALCAYQALGCEATKACEMMDEGLQTLLAQPAVAKAVRLMVCSKHHQRAHECPLASRWKYDSEFNISSLMTVDKGRVVPLAGFMSALEETTPAEEIPAARDLVHDMCVTTMGTGGWGASCQHVLPWLALAVEHGALGALQSVTSCFRELNISVEALCYRPVIQDLVAQTWEHAASQSWDWNTTMLLLQEIAGLSEAMPEYILKHLISEGHARWVAFSSSSFRRAFSNVKQLNIAVHRDWDFEKKGSPIQWIPQVLQIVPGLEELEFRCPDCDRTANEVTKGFVAIALRLQRLHTLSILGMRFTAVSFDEDVDVDVDAAPDEAEASPRAVKNFTFRAERCNFEPGSLRLLGRSVLAGKRALTHLMIRGGCPMAHSCDLGDDGATELSEALAGMEHLQTLELMFNNVTWKGFGAIMERLPSMRAMTSFDMGSNRIGVGLAPRNLSFSPAPQLRALNFRGNSISDSAMVMLAHALSNATGLENLNLKFNLISNTGATALAYPLSQIYSLRWLSLSYNDIRDDGAFALTTALKHANSLRHFEIMSNSIGDAGALDLCKGLLESLPELEQIELIGNPYHHNTAALLRREARKKAVTLVS
mmetsp:Transcript_31890/g.74584  ORF Transcript_31890/g.74584 Transcript_31890/m.74584 type:complete len:1637 (-) Transcript_31890:55-4965(-)